MQNINKAFISGNLTRDPELRQTQSGLQVLSFGVAVNDSRKNPQTGQWEDVPNFIDCTMFGNRAQAVQQHLSKGTKVAIEGKLRWSQWEQDGQKRSKVEVIVDQVEFLSRASASQGDYGQPYAPQQQTQAYNAPQAPQSAQYAPQQGQQQMQYAQPSVYDEDIPF